MYDPKKSRSWKSQVAVFAAGHRPPELWKKGPLKLEVTFYLPRPPSVKRPKRALPTVKPDLDNLVKAVKDGLQSIIYANDSLITDLVARKRYDDNGPPGVYVAVEKLVVN